jgi:hypothetical protein
VQAIAGGADIHLLVNGTPVCLAGNAGEMWISWKNHTIRLDGGSSSSLKPLGDYLPITPFDLFCPFFSWPAVRYDGPSTLIGRGVQCFTVIDPRGTNQVKVWLDGKHSLPLAWELAGTDGQLLRRFRLRSVERAADGIWRVRRMQIVTREESISVEFQP